MHARSSFSLPNKQENYVKIIKAYDHIRDPQDHYMNIYLTCPADGIICYITNMA